MVTRVAETWQRDQAKLSRVARCGPRLALLMLEVTISSRGSCELCTTLRTVGFARLSRFLASVAMIIAPR
jgi:hypothetical protein